MKDSSQKYGSDGRFFSFLISSFIVTWFVGLIRPFPLVSIAEAALICLFLVEIILPGRTLVLSAREKYLLVGIAAWFGILMVSALYSGDFFGSGLEEVFSWRKVFTSFVVAFYFIRLVRIRSLLEVMFFFSVCMSFSLIVCTVLGVDIPRSTQAVIENHTTQPILLTWFFLPFYLLSIKSRISMNVSSKGFICLIILPFLTTFYVSQGRGGYLFFIVVSMVLLVDYFFKRPRQFKQFLVPGFGLILLVGTITGMLMMERLLGAYNEYVYAYDPVFDSKGASVSIRRHMWGITLDMIWAKPWFGTGAGQFASEYQSRVENMTGWLARPTDDPHNSYLHVAAEHGLFALTILLSGVIACIYYVYRYTQGIANRVFAALTLGFLATSTTSGHFNTFVEGRLFFLALYLAVLMTPEDANEVYD